MAQWSAKRRFLYGGGFILILALILAGIAYGIFYRTPTCSDGKQNGTEAGIDCGGSCHLICTNDALAPITHWAKVFNISGELYTVVAYVENPNINSSNTKATYQFKIYDSAGKLIATRVGQTSIPKNKKFAVFEVGIVVKGPVPKSADFEFTSFSRWEKDNKTEPDVSITNSTLITTSSIPRIEGTITNNASIQAPPLQLVVFVQDSKENVVAASQTFVDGLDGHSKQDFVFTWPKQFDLGNEECDLFSDISTSTTCAKKPNVIQVIYRAI